MAEVWNTLMSQKNNTSQKKVYTAINYPRTFANVGGCQV